MSDDIIIASEGLLKKLDRINKFENKYKVTSYKEVSRLVDEMKELADSLLDIESPENKDQLFQSELKRRLNGEALSLEQRVTPKLYDFDTIVSIYSIPKADINGLRDWLVANRDKTLDTVEKLYQTKDIPNFELNLNVDIPSVRRQAEEFAAAHIKKYHLRLGGFLQDLTQIGEFLMKINASPTIEERSYFNPPTSTLAIGIPAICFITENGSLHLRERDLIAIYGHEGMGHALNHVITKNNGLPYFLVRDSRLIRATMESVAQYYQNVIFEDLKNSPETQKDLGIQHKFAEIYQEALELSQLEEYEKKLKQYAITVLADKKHGPPQDPSTLKKKVELLNEVTLNPTSPLYFVDKNRNNFDSQGNLNFELVSELMYCAQPVQRALDEFAKQEILYEGEGRSRIDAVLLKGFWTPIGYVDNARLNAQQKK